MPRRARTHSNAKPSPACGRHEQRESAAKRGYGHKWRVARLAYLKAHPLCVVCRAEGVIAAATDVDHIIAHKGDMALFWDRSNWQSLCHSCHSRKTATQDR